MKPMVSPRLSFWAFGAWLCVCVCVFPKNAVWRDIDGSGRLAFVLESWSGFVSVCGALSGLPHPSPHRTSSVGAWQTNSPANHRPTHIHTLPAAWPSLSRSDPAGHLYGNGTAHPEKAAHKLAFNKRADTQWRSLVRTTTPYQSVRELWRSAVFHL